MTSSHRPPGPWEREGPRAEPLNRRDRPMSRSAVTPPSFNQLSGVGAAVRPGRGGPKGEDVIYMDLRKGLFAVADGAGRARGASQRLLSELARMAEGFRGIDWADKRRVSEIPEVLQRFRTAIESILADIPYGDTSTFTALLVLRCDTGPVGLLCHCGDSLLFHFAPETGLRQVSQTNFWMVGRSKKLYQAEAFRRLQVRSSSWPRTGFRIFSFQGFKAWKAALSDPSGKTRWKMSLGTFWRDTMSAPGLSMIWPSSQYGRRGLGHHRNGFFWVAGPESHKQIFRRQMGL